MNRRKILVVTGPTASGKTALSIRLAESLRAEIINADSVQVYRGFRIGAGAPDEETLARAPHHLFGTRDPAEEWNAGLFREHAAALIEDISCRGALPLIAGGTGLYIRALLSGLVEAPVSSVALAQLESEEEALRASGKDLRERTAVLHARLSELDAESAREVRETDSSRVRRALLVALSGGSLAKQQQEHGHRDSPYEALVLCLLPERQALYEVIDDRVDSMLESGFLAEVENLRVLHSDDLKPFQSIGYKEALQFLRGELSEASFRLAMKQSTRNFAKRQVTWWRHQPAKLGWATLPSPPPVDFPGLLTEVQRFLLESGTDAGSSIGFYRLSGVGFLSELG